ncbi:MAG: hypothetical protein ABFD79_03380 [Phycisphaerales bacterium]
MKKRRMLFVALLLIGCLPYFTNAAVSTPNTPPTQPQPSATTPTDSSVIAASTDKSGFEKFRDWFHNPTDWFSQGADFRWRYVYAPNIDSLNNEAINRDYHFTRNRVRYWNKTKITDDVDFNIRWTWEFRTWDEPVRKDRNFDADEVVWDHFNLTVRNLFDLPLTMVAGKQDIILGKGWLVAEGTPLDGSRTNTFDALRFTYDVPNRDTKLDLIYVFNRADEDAWLRPFNDHDRHFSEEDQQGAIVYLTDKSNPNLQKEAYFIYKNSNPIDTVPKDVPDPFPPYWPRKSEIFTFGGALSGPIASSEHWKYRTEGAFQWGKKESKVSSSSELLSGNQETFQAFGTVNRLEYHFNDKKKNILHGTFEYLSGDNPDNDKITAFDPLWGRWPQWSELYIYTYILETRIAETTNLYRFNIGHEMMLTDKVSMSTDYHALFADENTEKDRPHPTIPLAFSSSGKFRGHLATWWLKYQLTKNLKGHFVVEYFSPGNYYASENRDPALWTRVNLEYTF